METTNMNPDQLLKAEGGFHVVTFFSSDYLWAVGPTSFQYTVLFWLDCFYVMIYCIIKETSMRAKLFLCFNNNRI